MSFIASLQLTNFRSYASAGIEGLEGGPVVLCGPNGAGKTNILEAVSLFSPGRGLRAARLKEMQRELPGPGGREGAAPAGDPWALSARVALSRGESVRIGTGLDPESEKRVVRIGGEAARGQAALADYLACVWLTPQMDRLFIDPAGARRKFLDRLVFTLDPGHTGRVTRYENALSQRSKLLREGRADPAWLAALESQMAETGIAIAAARLDYLRRLQRGCDAAGNEESRHFPRALLALEGEIEEGLARGPALGVEEGLKERLMRSREADAATGGAAAGPHRSDFAVRYAASHMPAAQCSTGEQKALLVGIILAHARLIAAERGAPPVLLLDEVAAHLDESRRAALFAILLAAGGQVWLTGTDEAAFAPLRSKGSFFSIEGGAVLKTEERDL